jgi:hypothetical protein
MSRPQQLALFISAGIAISLMGLLVFQLVGIHVHPLIVIGALIVLWVLLSGERASAGSGPGSRGGRTTNPEEERRALAEIQKKYADELIEEHRLGKISTERRNEQLKHVLNAPPPNPPGPRRPS